MILFSFHRRCSVSPYQGMSTKNQRLKALTQIGRNSVSTAGAQSEDRVPDDSIELQTDAPVEAIRNVMRGRGGWSRDCADSSGVSSARRLLDRDFELYSPNITPDKEFGVGDWTADHFYNMLHTGRSRDGVLLYPAMPFPAYTKVTRADSDAIFCLPELAGTSA
jgi:hypothetical protein